MINKRENKFSGICENKSQIPLFTVSVEQYYLNGESTLCADELLRASLQVPGKSFGRT